MSSDEKTTDDGGSGGSQRPRSVMDGAAERLAAWRSSPDPHQRDARYREVLRRQFAPPKEGDS